MPVIVVGADTQIGRAIISHLVAPGREVRAFVSDPDAASELKQLGVKVAFGDVSDDGHLEAACTNVFCVVFVGEAALDGRERSFRPDPKSLHLGWAEAAASAHVKRVVWVGVEDPPPVAGVETAVVEVQNATDDEVATRVALLDDAEKIG